MEEANDLSGRLPLRTDDVVCHWPSEKEGVALQSLRLSRLLCQSRSHSELEMDHCSKYLESADVTSDPTIETPREIIDNLANPVFESPTDDIRTDNRVTIHLYY